MTNKKLKVGNVPNLRFPEFSGEWEVKKLGDIGDVKMCRRIFNEETSPVGEIPFFKIGSFGKEADAFISKELYLNYKNKFSFPKKGDILISAAGTIGRTVVFNGEDAYYQDSNIVWIDNNDTKITNTFLFYILQIVKFNTEGGTIQRLYNNILKSTKFKKPSKIYDAPKLEKPNQFNSPVSDLNPGKIYADKLNKSANTGEGGDSKLYRRNMFLGDFKTKEAIVGIFYRDFGLVDGDLIRILVNDKILIYEIYLGGNFQQLDLKLEKGINKIDFEALSQGYSGPNTAEFKIFDEKGVLISANQWNLGTGFKATVIVIKE